MEENEKEDAEPRQMTRDDFDYVVSRIDRMELSVASIINKVTFFLSFLSLKNYKKIYFRLIVCLVIWKIWK